MSNIQDRPVTARRVYVMARLVYVTARRVNVMARLVRAIRNSTVPRLIARTSRAMTVN
jgi:hypothetical protein